MQITNVKGRKAISPVIATVILIAITLIAAIAIAGFVFGLFGSFTSTARLAVSATSISATSFTTTCTTTCTITVQNTGTANAAITSITLVYGGVTYTGTIATASQPTVTAGSSYTLELSVAGTWSPSSFGAASSGQAFSGSLGASNGGSISFTGTFE
ncbi:MAG: type IV pilin [Nitrososphaerota archaeon]|nr:type IV pilin [Nitrososphaerota archaeon]